MPDAALLLPLRGPTRVSGAQRAGAGSGVMAALSKLGRLLEQDDEGACDEPRFHDVVIDAIDPPDADGTGSAEGGMYPS